MRNIERAPLSERSVEVGLTMAALGLATGALGIAARRRPLVGWFVLSPLGMATYLAPAWAAALAGALAGALIGGAVMWGRGLPGLAATSTGVHGVAWGVAFGVAAWLCPDGAVAWCGLALPCATVAALMPLRWAGAPRWVSNPLACSQEPWLAVVHTARLGGDLVPAVLLALAGALPVLLLAERPISLAALAVSAVVVMLLGAALGFGVWSLRRARWRVDQNARQVRVAAVVVDPPHAADGLQEPESTLGRYAPEVQRALAAGARVIVLPEVALRVTAESRERCWAAVSEWAREGRAVVVAPFFDASERLNGLRIFDADGAVVAEYEKQHPAPAPVEPPRTNRMPPAAFRMASPDDATLSAVLCVDLDYADLVAPVRGRGGILLTPANDWPELEQLHHRTAVWAPVMAGVPLLRATGHGISAVFDAAGRVLTQSSSCDGPTVLCADVAFTANRTH